MFRDVILALVCLILTFGFYTKELDWVLIYWGCAPIHKRNKMNEKAIHATAWISSLVLTMMFGLNILARILNLDVILYYMEIAEVIVFVLMILITSIFALNIKEDIDTKNDKKKDEE